MGAASKAAETAATEEALLEWSEPGFWKLGINISMVAQADTVTLINRHRIIPYQIRQDQLSRYGH